MRNLTSVYSKMSAAPVRRRHKHKKIQVLVVFERLVGINRLKLLKIVEIARSLKIHRWSMNLVQVLNLWGNPKAKTSCLQVQRLKNKSQNLSWWAICIKVFNKINNSTKIYRICLHNVDKICKILNLMSGYSTLNRSNKGLYQRPVTQQWHWAWNSLNELKVHRRVNQLEDER